MIRTATTRQPNVLRLVSIEMNKSGILQQSWVYGNIGGLRDSSKRHMLGDGVIGNWKER